MHDTGIVHVDPECQLLFVGQVSEVHIPQIVHQNPGRYEQKIVWLRPK